MTQIEPHRFQPSPPPEDLFGPTQVLSALQVFLQHMPNNEGAPAYRELTCCLIEMADLKNFEESTGLCAFYPAFIKDILNTWDMQNRVITQVGKH